MALQAPPGHYLAKPNRNDGFYVGAASWNRAVGRSGVAPPKHNDMSQFPPLGGRPSGYFALGRSNSFRDVL